MTDEVKQLYAEIAALVYEQCQRFGCNDANELTSCCTLQECQTTAKLAERPIPPQLAIQNNRCTLLPHERPRCALHVCNRLKWLSSPDFLTQYEVLLKKLDLLLHK